MLVSNAPLEHAGVAGGLQQAAMRVGGSLGTAVLGLVMATRVDAVLPEKWADAKLPPLSGAGEEKLKSAAEVGVAPPAPEGTPGAVAHAMTEAVHGSFMSGMALAFTCAAVVAVVAAAVAFFTNRRPADPVSSVQV